MLSNSALLRKGASIIYREPLTWPHTFLKPPTGIAWSRTWNSVPLVRSGFTVDLEYSAREIWRCNDSKHGIAVENIPQCNECLVISYRTGSHWTEGGFEIVVTRTTSIAANGNQSIGVVVHRSCGCKPEVLYDPDLKRALGIMNVLKEKLAAAEEKQAA